MAAILAGGPVTHGPQLAQNAAFISDRSIFSLQHRSGIWAVKLDAKFYGDYRALRLAMEGIDEKARSLRAAGRTVQIITLSADGAVLASTVIAPPQERSAAGEPIRP